jgi:FkbM family methyltransferase
MGNLKSIKFFKKQARNLLKYVGYDLVKLRGGLGTGSIENEILKFLYEFQVDLVLDIGANKGQFAEGLFYYGYDQQIISFEPISVLNDVLKRKSKNNKRWHIYQPCCLGEVESQTVINISNLMGNSSVLPIKNTKYNVENSHFIKEEIVPQITLSSLNTNAIVQNSKNIFIKMDIQGYEFEVLMGLKNNINYNIIGFYIELSLVELYENQKDYLQICQLLKKHGFDLVYLVPESMRKNRMIQCNGLFLRNDLSYK